MTVPYVGDTPWVTARTPWRQPFHVMAKPMGARCNLECSYCFYLEKTESVYAGQAVPRMSDEMLERFVRDYLASQPGEEVTFAWQGGEPTLAGLGFFKKAVDLQRRYAAGRRVTNALQTNGTLLDDAWGEFLKAEGFLVGISVDGPETCHDSYRVDRLGVGTWRRVMRGVRVLKRHGVEFNTLTVLHRGNVGRPKDVYEFLKAEGSGFMQFIPLVERRVGVGEGCAGLKHGAPVQGGRGLVAKEEAAEAVAEACPPPGATGRFLCEVFDRWVKRDVGKVFVQLFDVALGAWAGLPPGLCTFQERCGRALALEHNGDVYACDHYVYGDYKYGNIAETPVGDMGNGKAGRAFGDAKADLSRQCRECPVRFVCNGDCPKHRFVAAGEGEPGISYLCGDYLRFFSHVDGPMRTMAGFLREGRAPAEIMSRGGMRR